MLLAKGANMHCRTVAKAVAAVKFKIPQGVVSPPPRH